MVLTSSQKQQLNRDILQYLCANQYLATAEKFAQESEQSLNQVDPQGNRLQIKWKSILSLQKKVTSLEQKVQGLQEQLAKSPASKGVTNINMEDLFLPKVPCKFQLKGHKSTITCLAFHPQFTQLASSSEDGTIKIWEFETGDFDRTLKGHTNPVNCINYDPLGKYLVSSSSDLTIKLWDLNNDYQCCKTFYGHNHNISFVCFLDSDSIISSSRDKSIKLWEVSTGYCKKTFLGHENWVRSLAYTADLKTIVSCSDDQSIIVWNIDKQSPVNRFFAHQNVIEALAIVQGQKSSILMNSQFLKHKFTQQNKIKVLKEIQAEGSNAVATYHQIFILSGSRDKTIRIWLLNGEQLFYFRGHDNWVRNIDIHPSGKYMYSVSDDKTVRIWDLTYGKQKKKIQAHEHFISSIRFNKKYGVIGTAGNDMIIKIWHLK